MKILHVNTLDSGGAAIAAIRLHYLLLENGIESKILFLKRTGENQIKEAYYFEDIFVAKWLFWLNYFFNSIYNRRFTFYKPTIYFNGPDSLFNISKHPLFNWADVVHFHWVVKFLDWKKVFRNKSKKFVWTFHDMNPLTGGEHYKTGYNHEFPNIERMNINRKTKAVKGLNLTVISPSKWLSDLTKSSEIFHDTLVKTIRNPIDAETFRPEEKWELRMKYDLPSNKKVMLFVAENPNDARKGYRKLTEAMEKLRDKENYHLAVIGKKTIITGSIESTLFGTIKNENILADLYNAADLFVIPSLEDNLPNTVSESLLCGTPVAGFNTGGIPELVNNGINGYLSENLDELNMAITKTIQQEFDSNTIRNNVFAELNPEKLLKEFRDMYNG